MVKGAGLRHLCKIFQIDKLSSKSDAFEPDVGAFQLSFPMPSLIEQVG